MTTTIMRNSKVGDRWIYDVAAMNPPADITDPSTGQPSGNFTTGPVRLAFLDLFAPGKPGTDGQPGKFGATLLFTPYLDRTIYDRELYKHLGMTFPEYYDHQGQCYRGLVDPFRDQAEKIRFNGYTPGLLFTTVTSKFKPTIVDTQMNPIVDDRRAYPGVWAICSVNCYTYGKNPPQPKKGGRFGLQAVMILADDEMLGGGPADASREFAGVNVPAPSAAPAALFGGLPAPGAAPSAPPLPGQAPRPPAAPTSGYAPPAAPPAPLAPAPRPPDRPSAPAPAGPDVPDFMR